MEIRSNETFDCYETGYESWSKGKEITLDGVRLVPVSVLDKIRTEIQAYKDYAKDEKHRIAFRACLNVIDYYTKAESEAKENDKDKKTATS